MPMSSAEIAQMNGAFTQASMNRMAYSSAIGQGGVYGGQNGAGADAMMSGAANRASSVGAPMLSGAMGMLGLDPMSLGLRAGLGAFGAGAGLGGAVAAGGAVALPLMAAGAGIHYAGQQMYQGMGQQMDLNQTLRGSYSFRNQHGGSGFGRGDMSQIGGMMRGMTEQFGPGGEITSMGELTQLAGKMSTMGLAQGVRDVQEFTRRFKDMVGTLKTMAKDLGTTLEGAMEFAAAAKQSGVFGMNHVGRFTNAVRSASVSGNLAMSEVTGAASIGSQISRSIGGLGSQGAMAGIRTIGQIGTAQQMGVLSEEDIYNATGLTGAEGRQAFASSQMQRAGSWLQSGRGRRALASMAGKNGTLDESAVQQILAGGMGIQETMGADRSHVTGAGAPVNRANFIRNEGRLRGAAMARFGAFLPAIQLNEWAASKGININEMDDRSMLFAQRQLGMGRDEMDAAVKMANNMPAIMREMQSSERQDNYFQGLAQQRKMQGVSGIKQRYEQAREIVNGKLQKVGQDVFNSGSEAIDSFMNDLFGTYVETFSKDLDDSMRQMQVGGAAGKHGAANLGLGGGGRSRFAGSGGGFGLGGRAQGLDFARQMRRGVSGDFGDNVMAGWNGRGGSLFSGGDVPGAVGRGLSWVVAGESGVSQMQRAGFDLRGMNSQQMQDKLQSIATARSAYETSGSFTMSAATRDKIRSAYVFGVGGSGDSRVVSIQAALEQSDPITAARLRAAHSPEEKAAIIGQVERAAGVGEGSGLLANYNAPGGLPGTAAPGGFSSVTEENRAWAKAMGVRDSRSRGEKVAAGMAGSYASSLTAGLLGPLGLLKFGGSKSAAEHARTAAVDLVGKLTGSYQTEQAAGDFYKGKEFRDMASGLLSADPAERANARDRVQQAALDVGEKGTNFQEYKRMLQGSDAMEILERTGGDTKKMTDLEKRQVEAGRPMLGLMAGNVDAQQKRDQEEARRRFRVQGAADVKRMVNSGVYDAVSHKLTGDGGKFSVMQRAAAIAEAEKSGDLERAQSLMQDQSNAIGLLSEKEALQYGGKLAGTAQGQDLLFTAGMAGRLKRERRGGLKGVLNQELGLGLSGKELAAMDENGLAAMAGVTDPKTIKNIQDAFKSGSNMKLAQAMKGLQEDEGVKKHKEEVSKAEAEARDPFGAEQVKLTHKANSMLELIAKHTGATSDEIKRLNEADPETKKK